MRLFLQMHTSNEESKDITSDEDADFVLFGGSNRSQFN
jgi:hypothetical protein